MTEEYSPWEVGLGFSINRDKVEFRGKNAVLNPAGKEKIKAAGISVDHTDSLVGGEKLLIRRRRRWCCCK